MVATKIYFCFSEIRNFHLIENSLLNQMDKNTWGDSDPFITWQKFKSNLHDVSAFDRQEGKTIHVLCVKPPQGWRGPCSRAHALPRLRPREHRALVSPGNSANVPVENVTKDQLPEMSNNWSTCDVNQRGSRGIRKHACWCRSQSPIIGHTD